MAPNQARQRASTRRKLVERRLLCSYVLSKVREQAVRAGMCCNVMVQNVQGSARKLLKKNSNVVVVVVLF